VRRRRGVKSVEVAVKTVEKDQNREALVYLLTGATGTVLEVGLECTKVSTDNNTSLGGKRRTGSDEKTGETNREEEVAEAGEVVRRHTFVCCAEMFVVLALFFFGQLVPCIMVPHRSSSGMYST